MHLKLSHKVICSFVCFPFISYDTSDTNELIPVGSLQDTHAEKTWKLHLGLLSGSRQAGLLPGKEPFCEEQNNSAQRLSRDDDGPCKTKMLINPLNFNPLLRSFCVSSWNHEAETQFPFTTLTSCWFLVGQAKYYSNQDTETNQEPISVWKTIEI